MHRQEKHKKAAVFLQISDHAKSAEMLSIHDHSEETLRDCPRSCKNQVLWVFQETKLTSKGWKALFKVFLMPKKAITAHLTTLW